MKKLIAFDVNETLLDLNALDPLFEKAFGRASIRSMWFATVLRNALVATITGQYDDFGKIASASLDMTARQNGLVLSDEHRSAILGAIHSLPAHPDVVPGLERLKSAGFRLFTLTNSPPRSLKPSCKMRDWRVTLRQAFLWTRSGCSSLPPKCTGWRPGSWGFRQHKFAW